MPNLPVPQQCTAVAMMTNNCTQQLTALAQGYSRNDLRCEIPRLTKTAVGACKLTRDMLTMLLEELEPKKPTRVKALSRARAGEHGSRKTSEDCPWQLTRAAVRKYRNLLGRHATEAEAVEQLRGMAIHCTTSRAVPKELDNGTIQYRGGRPLRPRLIVKREGDELMLIDVLPDSVVHESKTRKVTP